MLEVDLFLPGQDIIQQGAAVGRGILNKLYQSQERERERESRGLNSSKSWLLIFFTPHVTVYVRITNV